LELLRGNQISATQERPFDVILLSEIKIHPVRDHAAIPIDISAVKEQHLYD